MAVAACVGAPAEARPKATARGETPRKARSESKNRSESKSKRKAKSNVVAKPVEPPRPDPLAAAWKPAGAPQLGDGSVASEFLVSALRTLGLRGSFDTDSYVRHLFYVNAMGRKDAFAEDDWAESVRRRLASKGLVARDRTPHKGDLVFFRLGSSDRSLAGVVDSVGKGKATFIAPLGDRVGRGTVTFSKKKGTKTSGDTALLKCEPMPSKSSKKSSGKKGSRPVAMATKATPCRAGELLVGTADIDAVQRVFR
jgi:hypothetical protein